MIAYASRTGTKRNLDALWAAKWRLMISAKGVLNDEGFPHALDNGAWWSFANKQPFDERAFIVAYQLFGATADFFVLPDIVAGGYDSLAFSLHWLRRLGSPRSLPLLAVQDGMSFARVDRLVGPNLGIFVGGTTAWKERTMLTWGKVARNRRAYLHVGRVNTAGRIALCGRAGANSFDGSSVSRFVVNLPKLEAARRRACSTS